MKIFQQVFHSSKFTVMFLLIPLLVIMGCTSPHPGQSAIPDPSALYCSFLGYKLESRCDSAGNEYGMCVFPDGSQCDTWAFFRGACGEKWSYCAKKGWETLNIRKNNGSWTAEYCACSRTDSTGHETIIPLTEFMEQRGDTLIRPGLRNKRHP